MPILEVENLAMRFGRRWLFRDLSLTLDRGELMAVTGSNGSGKSTLIRILAGVLTPTRGTVSLRTNGEDIHKDARSQAVGLVAPYLQLYDGLTFAENLTFVRKVRGADHSSGRILDLMERVTLADRADDLVGTFSSGMKQRARFAMALASESDLYLLDEPSSNLDVDGITMIKGIIDDLVATGAAIVLATNSQQETAWCQRSIRIEDFLQTR
jgi:heme exporter protein A